MAVKLRLARFGCRNRPFYRIMAADGSSRRDGKHLEVLGFYDPLSGKDGNKRMGLKLDRVKYWLSVGAQPSEPVERILLRAGILPQPPLVTIECKGGPSNTSSIDPINGGNWTPVGPEAAADAMDGGEDGCDKECGDLEKPFRSMGLCMASLF